MEKVFRKRGVLALLTVLFPLAPRLAAMLLSPLEYDEIWSLENFSDLSVGRIFTDLALPNNHPLNSLFIKLWTALTNYPQLIRIHSLFSGVCSVALAGVLARGLFRSRRAALWSMIFMALSAPAVTYSALARGYGLQLAFLLLFACGLVWSGELRRFVPGKFLPEAAMVVGAAGAILSVPSAPIFLASAVVGAAMGRKLPKRSVVVGLAMASAVTGAYLAWNFDSLREAQNWGRELGSLADWKTFVCGTCAKFVSLAALPLILCAVLFDRKRSLQLLSFAALVLVSAAVFRAGPERAYLPLCTVFALLAGRGAELISHKGFLRFGRNVVPVLALAALVLGYLDFRIVGGKWKITDYWGWFDSVRREPETNFVVFPATAGYPLVWNNNPEFLRDYRQRLVCEALGEREIVVFSGPGRINGMLPDGSETELELPVPGVPEKFGGREAYRYRLVPLARAPKAGDALLIVLPPAPERLVHAALAEVNRSRARFVSINPFMNYPLPGPGGTVLRSRMLFLLAPEKSADWPAVRSAGGRLYRFAPGKQVEKPLHGKYI